MKFKSLIVLFFCLLANPRADSQAYYKLQYQPTNRADIPAEDALLVIYDNGTGFVRINQPGSTLYEMEISEQFVFNQDGSVNSTFIYYEARNPVVKKGRLSPELKSLYFWFRSNPMNNSVDPWLVTVVAKDTVAGIRFLSVEVIGERQLSNSAFVLNYFLKDEAFYQNRFGPKSRGGGLKPAEKNTKLFLLVVAQTFDKKIGPATLIDARNVILTFQSMAAMLNIRPVIDSVFGDRYGRANVKAAINKINPKPNDIVIFWYSGHGFSDVKNQNARRRNMTYSFLDLLDPRQSPRPDPRDSTMNIEEIYQLIQAKPGRLKIVVGDCCNDEMIPREEDKAPVTPKPKGLMPKWNWNNVYALLMQPRQSMLMTAATQGQPSFSDNARGSVFTNALLASLYSSLFPDAAKPEWKKIWKTAQMQTITRIKNARIECPLPFQPKNTCQQTPTELKIN